MRRTAFFGALLLTACAMPPSRDSAPAPSAAPAALPTLRSGLDLDGFDRRVRPQDDLYAFAAGRWLDSTPIPADRSNYGTFTQLEDQAKAAVRTVVESAAAAGAAAGTDQQKIGDFYASFLDSARIDVLGVQPLQEDFAGIAGIRTARDVYLWIGRLQRRGVAHPVQLYIGQDSKDSSVYLTGVYQSGLTMPDRDYYLKPDERSARARVEFEAYVQKLLALAGDRDAASGAKRIAALESRLANHHWSRVDNRDPVRTYNRVDLAAAAKLAPGFDWQALLEGAGLDGRATVLDINQPSYVRELARLIRMMPVADWRLYLKFRVLDAYAPYLATDFERAHFEFHERSISGVEQPKPRWQRAVQTMDGAVGELVGKLYVEATFPPESKARMVALVENLRRAFAQSIDSLEWMSPATKEEARRKLAKITVKIGYPDRWRDYGSLTIRRDDLVGNVRRSSEFEFDRQAAKLGRPLERDEWLMTPQTVNAYYYPPMNEIVFPAAILRPPFFDPSADDAVNYGGIGAVIGHEISHAFDDQGRQFDGDGNLRDWWTFDDNVRFRARAGRLIEQFGAYSVLDAQKLNGELTLGENIGDLSGLAVSFRAYQLALGGVEAPVIDGFTGPQRFFLGWGQIWRRKYRDDELRRRLVVDPHSPSEYRCNGIVTNLDEFHAAFGLQPGDVLYRPASDRVRIW